MSLAKHAAHAPAFNPVSGQARPAQFDRSQQHRRAMLAKIQIARKDLAMEEDDYRQIVFDKTGRTSLKEASETDLHNVLEVMKSKGFRPLAKAGSGPGFGAQHPMARKARALWISLHQLGVIHNASEQAFEAFAKRQIGCEKLVWARQSDAFKLIEALKNMAERNGWPQYDRNSRKALAPLTLQSSLCQVILAKLKAADAIPADWSIDLAAKRLCGMETALDRPFGIEDYARLAGALGAKLRELAPTALRQAQDERGEAR